MAEESELHQHPDVEQAVSAFEEALRQLRELVAREHPEMLADFPELD